MEKAALGLCKLSICSACAPTNKPFDYHDIFSFTLFISHGIL